VKTAIVVALLLVALPAPAVDWKSDLIQSTKLLQAGEYEKALKIDDRVIDQMVSWLGGGSAETSSFALVLSHKALALAGLGHNDDAIWYWHEALSLHPSYGTADLTSFGAPGVFLKAHPIEPIDAPRTGEGHIKAPIITKRVEPKYPEGVRALRGSGIVIVETLIGKDGNIHDARVLKSADAPALAHCALEALRHWRFDPATLDGQPVDVIFNLTVRFHLR